MSRVLSRRTLLKGFGASIALPWLDAMAPVYSWAQGARRQPVRMAFLYVPNGIHMRDWTPTAEGELGELPSIMRPLDSLKSDLTVITGLTADKARANGDGAGDHARAMAAYLTGAQPRKTDGSDFRAGISVDQVAAYRVGDQTLLPSLEIGCDRSAQSGNCDSGYSCVYSSTISWRSATMPMPKIVNPRDVFDRLFSSESAASRARRNATRRSILDFVREESTALQVGLGSNDRRKLDEYFSAVRDIEQRIERAARLPQPQAPSITLPENPPAQDRFEEHVRLLGDLMVLAFQTDVTRICTFVFGNEGSNRIYRQIGITEAHHELSHHENNPAKQNKIRQINTFHVTQLAYVLNKLKDAREGDSSLLDNCMVVYGSGNSDGNRHNHDDLPILLAGKGGGSIRTGRHVRVPRETPLNNLWLSMLDRMQANVEQLGDSTGRLQGLS